MPATDSRDKVEEIKNRLDIVDVIGRDITLHHKGGGEYVGTVGTKGSSGESLKVSKNMQAWKDHKNEPGGDVLDWIGYNAGYKDTRGSDFPEVLKIAADLAGVELGDATEEETEAAKEKADIHNLFTAATEIYHNNITQALYDYILQKWGITKETVDNLKIGYARIEPNIKGPDEKTLKKSGLVYVNNGKRGGEVFRGRIIFPYWKNGKVVYLIGRQTEETPKLKDGSEPPKYQKLLVHSDKFPYVSAAVQNSYFYGEDRLRNSSYCIITEGVADCISMLEAGFPCISPVTVNFREKDHPKLISLAEGLNRVYICNDNEENEAGLKGALNTAEALESAGIETRLIELPKPEGIDKIDIADYMKEHSPEDFRGLINSSARLWTFKLNQVVLPASLESPGRLKAFRAFISNDLRGMISEEWKVFVNNEVPPKFKLSKKDVRSTIEEIGKSRKSNNKKEVSQPEEDKQDEKDSIEDILNNYPEIIREQAYKILEEGDPLKFILDTWNLRHVGDRNIGENCLCSVASTYIINTRGLHVKPSGESGKGKSDAVETVLILLPEHKYISGSMSSKSLYYHPDLKSGTIIYSDDANFTDDTIATLKQSTSNFQFPCKHRTVVNQEYAEYLIPERCSYWFSTVDAIPDPQLANRFINGDVDGSKEQDKNVYDHIKASELDLNLPIDDDVLICRCIFDILGKELYIIKIPYINAIEWTNIENRRNFPKFLDILRSVTFFSIMQREKINGYYLSDIEDFDKALSIYKGTSKNNATNLSDLEIKVLKFIEKNGSVTLKDLMKYLEVSRTRVVHILHGKDGNGGMFAKVQQLNKIDRSKTEGGKDEDKITTRENQYEYNGPKLGFEIYDTVAKIDKNKAEEEKVKFIEKLSRESVTTVTHCNPSITTVNVTLKTSTIDRINSCVTLKRKNVIKGNCNTDISEDTEQNECSVKNECVSCSEKEGYSVTLEDKKGQLNVINECNPEIEGDVILGYSGYTSENKENIYAVVDLLKKALRNLAKTEYHSTVNDLPAFVQAFNEKTPSYVELLGYQIVYDEAERLHKWGFR
jgi:DNA primase